MPAPTPDVQLALRVVFLTVGLGLSACASTPVTTLSSDAQSAHAAGVSYGTIVSMRGVVVQNAPSGAAALGESATGGVGNSRSDVRGTILSAVSSAVAGGMADTVADSTMVSGHSVEFIIQEDASATPISVVQSNELNFAPGERIALTHGIRTRIARAGA